MEATTITVGTLVAALKAARVRCNDNALSHQVQRGKFRLVRVTMNAQGRATVEVKGPWRDAAAHLDALNQCGA